MRLFIVLTAQAQLRWPRSRFITTLRLGAYATSALHVSGARGDARGPDFMPPGDASAIDTLLDGCRGRAHDGHYPCREILASRPFTLYT